MRMRRALCLAPLALLALGLLVPSASATQLQRPFLETFGPSAQPEFEVPESIGIERASGAVLVGVGSLIDPAEKIATFSRLNADGTAAPFAALGTNTIDGQLGPGGKPCVEEPASCDKTPQNGLSIGRGGFPYSDQIAFDPTNGDIYITQNAQNLVDIFSSEGRYLGQLTQADTKFSRPCGIAVDAAGTVYVAQNNKISTFAPSGNPPVNADNTANLAITKSIGNPCRMALGTGPSAGWIFVGIDTSGTLKVNPAAESFSVFAEGYGGLVAVDPTNGNPLLYSRSAAGVMVEAGASGLAEVAEFDGSPEVAGAPLSRLMVEKPNLSGVWDYAIDAEGKVYVAPLFLGAPPTSILTYGEEPAVVPTTATEPASEITSSAATLTGTVNAEGIAVGGCFFEWGPAFVNGKPDWANTTPCEEAVPPDSTTHTVTATISGLTPNGTKYFFRLVARNENGTERSTTRSFLTGSSAETKPATVTGLFSATLNGTAHPEGNQYEECFFEWGIATNPGFEQSVPCTPSAGEIPADTGSHPVSAELSGLQEATTYRFRLKAKSSAGTQTGPELSFETFGRPRIEALRASFADQGTATLEAEINPRGFPTSYRFEWGPSAGYGNVSPPVYQPLGGGTSTVRVRTQVTGLAPASTYHFRVIASGEAGTTQSEDQVLETLNACGLPEGRCLELVSPSEPGAALPLENLAGLQLLFQAAEAPGGLAYEAEIGFPGATYGGEAVYRGSRGTGGWATAQYNPSLAGGDRGGGAPYQLLGLSPDLECGVASSRLALTSDPLAREVAEAGGVNLYRRGLDGSYMLITYLPAVKRMNDFALVGMADDCSRVVFTTGQEYPGIAVAGEKHLYEWVEGTLRSVGLVPSGGGEAAAAASPGFGRNTYNAVSEDGRRVFFTAISQSGNDAGKEALFVRIDGARTLDVSQSPLAVDSGAVYQGASPDGSRVYFTANAGLTAQTSATGRDLYECHIIEGPSGPECELTDLSVNPEAGGVAEAGGSTGSQIGALVGAAEDGSRVYFIARGQLVAGRGRTLAGNEAASSYSLYLHEAGSGAVRYVGSIGEGEVDAVTTGNVKNYTSRASGDGRFLAFESSEALTGYESGGRPMAYLYDALRAGGAGSLACVSCRQDGKPTLNPAPGTPGIVPATTRPLASIGKTNESYQPQSLAVRDGAPVVFFRSLDALAAGGVEGEWNLYQWAHGQVFQVASDLPGATQKNGGIGTLQFLGASADGTDLYFADAAALNWENPDARRAVWDARIGGGFAPPPASPSPCDPGAEGSCQGPGQGAPPGAPAPGSATFNGPGNVNPKQQKKHKKKHRKHHKKKGKHKKGKGKGKGNKHKNRNGKKNKNGKKGKGKQRAGTKRGTGR